MFSILFISCNIYIRDNFKYRNDDKKVWINTFKTEVFYSCLNEGYKNDSLRIIFQNKDLFNLYDGYDIETIDFARKIGKQIIIKMPFPNIKIDIGEENLKKKNFISYNCLNYYASKELDSIANKKHDEYLKQKLHN